MTVLSANDVEALTNDPSGVSRAATAAKLSADFNAGTFSATEVALAIQIFRIMLKDTEVRVRAALSEQLKASAAIPRDIARALAEDVELVSLNVLEHSPILTVDDLVEIISTQRNAAKMKAVARRATVPEPVTEALIAYGDAEVAGLAARNPGAAFSEVTLDRMLDRFGGDAIVTEPLVDRATLPVRVAERLTALVADHTRERLIARHKLDAATAMELVLATRERATLNLAKDYSEFGVATLVGQLLVTNRLSGSLLLRAACMGHRVFLEHALARRAGIPLANALIMMRDEHGFERLWGRTGLSAGMLPAISAAYRATREIEDEGRDLSADDFSRRIVERVMTQYELFGVEFARDDLEYLFTKISSMGSLPNRVQ